MLPNTLSVETLDCRGDQLVFAGEFLRNTPSVGIPNSTFYYTSDEILHTITAGAYTTSWLGQMSISSGEWQWFMTVDGTSLIKVALEASDSSSAEPHIALLGQVHH